MAIIPGANYTAQTDVDATNYPLGRARNVSVVGDGTGTPLEKEWLNDLWGFEQALLAAAGITPSGSADTKVVSQYLQALQALFAAPFHQISTNAQTIPVTARIITVDPAVTSGGYCQFAGTGALPGVRTVINFGGNPVEIRGPGGGRICGLTVAGGFDNAWADIIFDGSAWYPIRSYLAVA